MSKLRPYSELKSLSKEELIKIYDNHTKNTVVGSQHYLDEIERRERGEENKIMMDMTRQMRNMTIGILILTVLNVFLVVTSLL